MARNKDRRRTRTSQQSPPWILFFSCPPAVLNTHHVTHNTSYTSTMLSTMRPYTHPHVMHHASYTSTMLSTIRPTHPPCCPPYVLTHPSCCPPCVLTHPPCCPPCVLTHPPCCPPCVLTQLPFCPPCVLHIHHVVQHASYTFTMLSTMRPYTSTTVFSTSLAEAVLSHMSS